MDLQEYVDRAAATDDLGSDEKAIRIALFGIAGEAGEVVSEAKKFFRDDGPLPGLRDRVREELGDLLWYVALLARRLKLDLNDVAEKNLTKTGDLWSSTMPPLPDYDDHPHDRQKLPRRMTIEFAEDRSGEIPVVRMMPQGELSERFDYKRDRERKLGQLGDPLDDNAAIDDGYRYHDIIHLGHAAVLGWSPVLRALMARSGKMWATLTASRTEHAPLLPRRVSQRSSSTTSNNSISSQTPSDGTSSSMCRGPFKSSRSQVSP